MRSPAEFAPMDAPMPAVPAASDGHEASGTIDRVRAVCELAAGFVDGTTLATRLADIRDRLDGALRIAIAGRVKAGKSTLLNALVGERLAPTDAGECTRVVTWYQFGPAYDVSAVASDGAVTSLAFRRVNGALQFDLGSLALDDEPRDDDRPNRAGPGEPRIVVSWPSSSLRNVTLIDTPGLDSLSSANSLRTAAFSALGEQRPSDADAVIYLMRHLHRLDAEFLGSFMDRSVANSSPVNSVAVLSRADEVGAGRLDALASARRIADRYQHNETLRTLCTAVVPIAGLIAETGLTLREDEVRALRTVAATPEPVLERMLRSADAFCEPESSELTVEIRRELLDRLGMFGVRFCTDQLRDRAACTGPELAELLVAESGLDAIRALIMDVFLPRAHVLKARAAVAGLRLLARELELLDPVHARQLAAAIERCESSSPEFAELRLRHLVLSGTVVFDGAQRDELGILTDRRGAMEERLGIATDADRGDLRVAALAGVERWRTQGSAPLADAAMREACETMARIYEGMFVHLHEPRQG